MSGSGPSKSVNRHLKKHVHPSDQPPSVMLQTKLASTANQPSLKCEEGTESDNDLSIPEDSSVSMFADETKEINIFELTKEDEATAPPDKKAAISKATSFKNLLMTQLPKAIVWYFLHSYLPDDLRMFTLANIGYFEIVFKMNEYEHQLQKFITELNEQATINPLYQNFQDLILQSRKSLTKKVSAVKPVVREVQTATQELCSDAEDPLSPPDTFKKDKRRKLSEPKSSPTPAVNQFLTTLYCDEELPTVTPIEPDVCTIPSSTATTFPLSMVPSSSSLPSSSSTTHEIILIKPGQTDEIIDVMDSVLNSVSDNASEIEPKYAVNAHKPSKFKKTYALPSHSTTRNDSCALSKANFQERLCAFRTDTHCSLDVGVTIVKGNMRRRVREIKLTEVTLKWLENCFNTGPEIILVKKRLNRYILEQFNDPEKVTSKRSVVSCQDTLRGVALHLIDIELQQAGGDRKKANNKFSHYQRQSRSAGDRLTKEYAEKYGLDAQNYNCSDIEEKMDVSLMIFNKAGYLIYCSLVLKKTNCIFYYDGESMFLVKERFVRAFGSRYNFSVKENKPRIKTVKDSLETPGGS